MIVTGKGNVYDRLSFNMSLSSVCKIFFGVQAKSDFSLPASSFYLSSPVFTFHSHFSLLSLSCIAGYSPYASFPSKTLATNLVSDLSSSSPLDLGNWFNSA